MFFYPLPSMFTVWDNSLFFFGQQPYGQVDITKIQICQKRSEIKEKIIFPLEKVIGIFSLQ